MSATGHSRVNGIPVLQVERLSIAFPKLVGAVHAVRDCTFSVRTGEILGLVGESGSGKSVTAMACLGLTPGSARISGSIELAGRPVLGASNRELAELRGGGAAMIFQDPGSALNPFFTVGTQIMELIRRRHGCDGKQAKSVAAAALNTVRLPDPEQALGKYPHQMSGGQLQRVMIAMALVCRPQLLIADEPTTALDVTVQAQILLLLRDLAKQEGLAILFITHDLGVVASLCDRVAVMYAGSIVEMARVTDLYDAPCHPYTAKLLEIAPQLGQPMADRLISIPGQVPDLSSLPQGCAFAPRCDRATAVCRNETPLAESARDARLVTCFNPLGGEA